MGLVSRDGEAGGSCRRLRIAGFAIPAAICIAAAAAVLPRAYPPLPPATPLLVDRRGGFLAEDSGGDGPLGFWLCRAQDDPFLTEALIAIEDKRFWSHPGVDPRSVARAIYSTASGRRQGASTIAMQVVRLAHPSPRTLPVKIAEASAALVMTAVYGRPFILDRYLSTLPQGNRIFGVAYAARRYFRKPVADLSKAESALIAAIPQAPGDLNLFDPIGFGRARERAALIIEVLEQEGKIDQEEKGSTLKELAAMAPPRRELRPMDSIHFIERVFDDTTDQKNPKDKLRSARSMPTGANRYRGPTTTTLDPGLQEYAAALVDTAINDNRRFGADAAALIVASPHTGEVLAWASDSVIEESRAAGPGIDYAITPRSSGSTLKPFLYALGLDEGKFTPASIVADLPFSVLSPSGEYRAVNFDDAYLGPMLYGRALANSRNIPALRVLEAIGIDRFFELCRTLGLAQGQKDSLWYGYGLAIGGLEVTLKDLVAAYATLVSDGQAKELKLIGAQEEAQRGKQVFSPSAARWVLGWLSDPQARAPSFPRAGPLEYTWPVAVKTGTSQGFRDAWAVACTPSYIVGMWIGNSEATTMNRVAGMVVAQYVRKAMEHLHPLQREGIDEELFPPPEGAVPMNICVLSGELAGPACPASATEWLLPNQIPHGSCSVHTKIAVDIRSGDPATEHTDTDDIAVRSVALLPPQYAIWGAQRGLGLIAAAPLPTTPAAKTIIITAPLDGAHYLLDPDVPARFQTLPLEASVASSIGTLNWYIDGSLLRSEPFPYNTRFTISPGHHIIQATSSDGSLRSDSIEINVDSP